MRGRVLIVQAALKEILDEARRRDPQQTTFHQAVEEVLTSLSSFLSDHPRYLDKALLSRIVEPERQVQFRVCWIDDAGAVRVNRGFRIQMNSAVGPYKGGLMAQNSIRQQWSDVEVDTMLHNIMIDIHHACQRYGRGENGVDYLAGANIAGFRRVADAMLAQGVV